MYWPREGVYEQIEHLDNSTLGCDADHFWLLFLLRIKLLGLARIPPYIWQQLEHCVDGGGFIFHQ